MVLFVRTMPKVFPKEVEVLVRHLSKENFSSRKIVEKVKNEGYSISKSGVALILNSIGERRNHEESGVPIPRKPHPRHIRTNVLIQKIDKWTDKENPPSQREMAKRLKTSVHTVSKVIHEDLQGETRRKRLVHALKESHKMNRKTNCRKLYERRLAGRRSEFAVTLDEALFYVSDCNGTRRIYYTKPGKIDHAFGTPKTEKFSEKFMVVGAMTGRGVVPLIRVPPNVKVNSQYYIDNVLKPLLEEHVAALYPGETEKVFVHHDAASSHTSKATAAYAHDLRQRLGMTIIPKEEIPVKSPDTSPMDFFGFGVLKQRLFLRKATTLAGVWKVLQQEWNSITPEKVQEVYNSWKWRLRLVTKRSGEHIETTKTIHKRSVQL